MSEYFSELMLNSLTYMLTIFLVVQNISFTLHDILYIVVLKKFNRQKHIFEMHEDLF